MKIKITVSGWYNHLTTDRLGKKCLKCGYISSFDEDGCPNKESEIMSYMTLKHLCKNCRCPIKTDLVAIYKQSRVIKIITSYWWRTNKIKRTNEFQWVEIPKKVPKFFNDIKLFK